MRTVFYTALFAAANFAFQAEAVNLATTTELSTDEFNAEQNQMLAQADIEASLEQKMTKPVLDS